MLPIEFYKRLPTQLEIFVKPTEETDALKPGAVATLTGGDEVTFTGAEQYPSGKFARFVGGPSVRLNRMTELSTMDADRAAVFLRLAKESGPKGNAALLLRAPLGALTEGGKVLRATDAAESEQDALKRLTLAKEAYRLASVWGKRAPSFPAPSLSEVKPSEKQQPKLEPVVNYDPAPSDSPWSLAAVAIVGLFVVGGYLVSGSGDESEDDDE